MVIVYWIVVALRRASSPVFLTWINRGLDSSVRATVISMHSQADALGQVSFGPAFGAIATIKSIRFGLAAGAFALLPGVVLLAFARRKDGNDSTEQPGGSVGHEPPD
jgi:DHA3 family tetracycline resistance protein-like MFS transporter